MDDSLQFRVLGPLEVVRDGRLVDVGGGRQRALLARLVMDAGRVVSSDQLVHDLWGQNPPASASQTLQSYVSRLRRALEPARAAGATSVLASEAPGYVLRAAPDQVDALRFEVLAEEGHAALAEGRYEDAHRTLTDALGLWRGDALADVAYEAFAESAASRLEGERLSAVEDQLEAALALGHRGALTPTLEQLVAANPLRERIRAQLVLALYRDGRQADALAALRDARRMMREELGIEPSPRLRRLETQILNQDAELDWQPPAGSAETVPTSATATFLFTDVEASTRLLQRLGDERFGEVIADHDALLRETLAGHGGVQGETQGDSFFFVFPEPAQAVEAAVAAQRVLAAHDWPEGEAVRVRIGVHTGEASVLDGKYLGLAVHRAARISDAGHGGQILASHTTAGLVERQLPYPLRDLGEHRLKDLERPLRLYQVVVEGLPSEFPPLRTLSNATELPTGVPAGGLTFVGRDAELEQLRGALDESLAGSGRIVLLEGEAGIGKSRLSLEIGRIAAEHGMPLLFGACYEGGWAATLWPWVQVLRRATELMKGEERAALAPELAQLLPELRGDKSQPPGDADARFRLYGGAVDALSTLAQRQPLLVVVDDLHWADPPSLQLLQMFAAHVVSLRVLLLATFREDEPGSAEALATPLAGITRYPWTRRIALGGLRHDAVRQVIRDTAEIEPPPNLVSVVLTRTAGNPFFVSELVRLLAAECDLEDARVLYTGIPLGVRDVVRRRLLALPTETRELLQLAAAIGRDFDFPLLARTSTLDAAACAEAIDPALQSRLVVAADGVGYRFSHGLVRETIVEELTPLRRARIHERVAEALRTLHGGDDDYAERIAEHIWHASELVDPADVVAALERAASVAIRRNAYEAGEPLLERALSLAKRLPPAERDEAELRMELELASLRMMTQGYSAPAVVAGFERVHEIARRSGRLWEVVKALHGSASALAVAGRFRRSHEVALQCLAAAEELGEPLPLAVGHLMVGIGEMHLGRITASRREFAASIEAYGRSRGEGVDVFELAVPLSIAGFVFGSVVEWIGGDEERARALRQRAITIVEELDMPFSHQVGMFFCAFLAALEDDPGACREFIERGRTAAGDHVFPVYAAVSAVMHAWGRGREGDDDALQELDATLAELETSGVRTLSHFFHALRADLVAARGDAGEGLAAFELAIAVSDRIEERFYLPELRRRRGELLLQLGREGEGVAELEHAAALAASQGAGGLERKARETLAGLRGAAAAR